MKGRGINSKSSGLLWRASDSEVEFSARVSGLDMAKSCLERERCESL